MVADLQEGRTRRQCCQCTQGVRNEEGREERSQLAAQADVGGMSCLTEIEQLFVEQRICFECYKDHN